VADPAAGVGVLAALFAGMVSFLSPCVLPLVPGYLSAVTGVSAAELDRTPVWRVLGPSLLFIASFSAIFILLGLTATGLGSTLQDSRDTLEKVAAALIIAMARSSWPRCSSPASTASGTSTRSPAAPGVAARW
jgi:cytochrome c-type biogenesis protein